jgi:hypothetical protein
MCVNTAYKTITYNNTCLQYLFQTCTFPIPTPCQPSSPAASISQAVTQSFVPGIPGSCVHPTPTHTISCLPQKTVHQRASLSYHCDTEIYRIIPAASSHRTSTDLYRLFRNSPSPGSQTQTDLSIIFTSTLVLISDQKRLWNLSFDTHNTKYPSGGHRSNLRKDQHRTPTASHTRTHTPLIPLFFFTGLLPILKNSAPSSTQTS